MSKASKQPDPKDEPTRHRPFRAAVWRGLAVVMPPLLTIVVFIWIWSTVDGYLIQPVEGLARRIIVGQLIYQVENKVPSNVTVLEKDGLKKFVNPSKDNKVYVQLDTGKWIPETIYDNVRLESDEFKLRSATAKEVYGQYVRNAYLQRYRVIPVFLFLFILILYLLGKFLAAGLGGFFLRLFEQMIHRLPFIRTVYSAAKQVTDFVFKEQEVEFTRVVAVEYPRKGVWSMGFVTGEGFLDIRSAANEPVLSILMPTSPMPATGFTITVAKSETIDLDITVDQAIQFCVSCGVVVPAHQQFNKLGVEGKTTTAIGEGNGEPSHSPTETSLSKRSDEETDGDD